MIVKNCQLCGSPKIKTVIDLGYHPLADTFLKGFTESEIFYPLQVFLCQDCGYTGLLHIVNAADRYQKNDYSYSSCNSPVALSHFKDMAKQVIEKTGLNEKDLAIDQN